LRDRQAPWLGGGEGRVENGGAGGVGDGGSRGGGGGGAGGFKNTPSHFIVQTLVISAGLNGY